MGEHVTNAFPPFQRAPAGLGLDDPQRMELMVARPRSARVAWSSSWYANVRMRAFGAGLGIEPALAGLAGAAIFHRIADAVLVRSDEGTIDALTDEDLSEIGWPEAPRNGAMVRGLLRSCALVGRDGVLVDWEVLAGEVLRKRGVSPRNGFLRETPADSSDGVSPRNSQTPTQLPEVASLPGGASVFFRETPPGKEVSPPHTPPLQERLLHSAPDGSSSSAPEAEKNQKVPPAGARAQDREPPWDSLLEAWNTIATEHRLPRVRRLDVERKRLLVPWWRACGEDFRVAQRAMFEAAKVYGAMEGDRNHGLFALIRPANRQKWITAAEEALDRPHADTVAGDFRDDLQRELEDAYPALPPAVPLAPVGERVDAYLNRLFADRGLPLPSGYEGSDPRRVRPGDVRTSAAIQREIRAFLSKHPERIPT